MRARAAVFLIALALAGCAAAARPTFYQLNKGGEIAQKSLDRVLWENEMPAEGDLLNTRLLNLDFASYHLVQVRTAEKPHVHERHDLSVTVQSGSGVMYLGKDKVPVQAGATIFIPHGVPHYFVNGGPRPAVALITFAPPFDGKDSVPVGENEINRYLMRMEMER